MTKINIYDKIMIENRKMRKYVFIYLICNRTRSTELIKKNSKKIVKKTREYNVTHTSATITALIVNNDIDVVCCNSKNICGNHRNVFINIHLIDCLGMEFTA